MGCNELPSELIARILEYLDPPGLRVIRRVSRVWDKPARAILFHEITLKPTDASEAEIKDEITRVLKHRTHRYHLGRRHDPKVYSSYRRLAQDAQILSEERLRRLIRQVVVRSTPLSGVYSPLYAGDGSLSELLTGWGDREETYEIYYKALTQISKLRELDHVRVQFLPFCNNQIQSKVESIYHREKVLASVFLGLLRHAQSKEKPTEDVRKLTIEYLRNKPVPGLTSSEAFRIGMSGIEELNLLIAQSGYGHDDDGTDYWNSTLWSFMPHLTECWLMPVCQQLKSISLCFDTYWGPIPGFFDASNLNFPRLESLTLGLYVLAHDDALDWVLRSRSLRSLQLHLCPICAEICISKKSVDSWKLKTHGWRKVDSAQVLYLYEGTWSYFLDRISDELPTLAQLGLQFSSESMDKGRAIEGFLNVHNSTASLTGDAYVRFDQCRTLDNSDYWTKTDRFWLDAPGEAREAEETRSTDRKPPAMAENARVMDEDALERLLATVNERKVVKASVDHKLSLKALKTC